MILRPYMIVQVLRSFMGSTNVLKVMMTIMLTPSLASSLCFKSFYWVDGSQINLLLTSIKVSFSSLFWWMHLYFNCNFPFFGVQTPHSRSSEPINHPITRAQSLSTTPYPELRVPPHNQSSGPINHPITRAQRLSMSLYSVRVRRQINSTGIVP